MMNAVAVVGSRRAISRVRLKAISMSPALPP